VETCAEIHCFDGLVLISSCDKNVPGHLLAAARLNLPAILVPGGPMLAGRYQGRDVVTTDLDAETWACGLGRGRLTPEGLAELGCRLSTPAPAPLGTANTMVLSEAVGLALPGSATPVAVSARRLWFAKQAGRRIVGLVREDLRPSRILTRHALENMVRALHAIGGSTNAVLHILALAQELDLGDGITLETVEKLSAEVDCIVAVRPSGPYTMADFDEAGGMPAVMKVLGDRLHLGCCTVTGATVEENIRKAEVRRAEVIERGAAGVSWRVGHPAQPGDSAVVRHGRPEQMMKHVGPARTFDHWRHLAGVGERSRQAGMSLSRIRANCGRPWLTGSQSPGHLGLAWTSHALVTDGKISGFAKGPFICQVSPEAALGGPIALVRDGDPIAVDIPGRRLDLLVPGEELAARRQAWTPPPPRVSRGFLSLYARLAEPAERGAGLPVRLDA
jgi:dihydroxy-acid dehydratase